MDVPMAGGVSGRRDPSDAPPSCSELRREEAGEAWSEPWSEPWRLASRLARPDGEQARAALPMKTG